MSEKADSSEQSDASGKREEKARRKPFYRRPLPLVLIAALVVVLIVAGVIYWLHARHYASTDDAFIDAHVVQIAPRVAGQVVAVHVHDNEEVAAGQPLFDVDPEMYQAQLDQAQADEVQAEAAREKAQAGVRVAQANADEAQAEVAVAQADADNASDRYARLKKLGDISDSQNLAVTQRDLDDAKARQRSTAASLESAKQKAAAAQARVGDALSSVKVAQAQLAAARARLHQAKLKRSYASVVAPQAGRITHMTLAKGDYVGAGTSVLALVPDRVWVTANFKETELTDMRPGQPVTIEIDAYPGRDFHGKVDSIQAGTGARFSLLPPQNATGNYVKVVQRVPVKIVFDNLPDDILLAPGMSVVPTVRVR